MKRDSATRAPLKRIWCLFRLPGRHTGLPLQWCAEFPEHVGANPRVRPNIYKRIAAVAVCFALFVPVFLFGQGEMMEGIVMPLQRYPDGKVKTLLTADRARMQAGGRIAIEGNLRVTLMSETGTTNGVAKAEKGYYSPREEKAECFGPVYLEKDGVSITGTNMVWISRLNMVRIETNAVLTLHRKGESIVGDI